MLNSLWEHHAKILLLTLTWWRLWSELQSSSARFWDTYKHPFNHQPKNRTSILRGIFNERSARMIDLSCSCLEHVETHTWKLRRDAGHISSWFCTDCGILIFRAVYGNGQYMWWYGNYRPAIAVTERIKPISCAAFSMKMALE